MSEEVKEFVELTQDIVSKGLDRHLYLQEQEFLVRNLLEQGSWDRMVEKKNNTALPSKICHGEKITSKYSSEEGFLVPDNSV